jgi:hypothetical protein
MPLQSKDNFKVVNLITLRYPLPPRYVKMFDSVQKVFKARLITGTVIPTNHLELSFGTALSYVNLFFKILCSPQPSIVDINALASARFNYHRDLVVDCRTPFSYELSWLGHEFLASFARSIEASLKDVGLVLTVNEPMAKHCASLGAKNIQVIPNYPLKTFKSTIDAEAWKLMHGLSPDCKVVLFSGGVRLRAIYGLDLLLESWRIVESSCDSCILVILGDDSIDEIKRSCKILGLKRVLLPGRVDMPSVANWINCAEVCVAPRTPGFSDRFYNDQDSNKIAEYASFKKQIVATSYAPSDQYLLVSPTAAAFSEGILKGLDGNISLSIPHYWEDNERNLLRSLDRFWLN